MVMKLWQACLVAMGITTTFGLRSPQGAKKGSSTDATDSPSTLRTHILQGSQNTKTRTAADAMERSQLMLRTYLSPHGTEEVKRFFYPGYQVFAANALHREPIIILDKGTNLSEAFIQLPNVKIMVSEHESIGFKDGGYDLQQLDTFYMDTWAPDDAEFIIAVDSDSFYYSIPTAESMFDHDGCPHVIGSTTLKRGPNSFEEGTEHFPYEEGTKHFLQLPESAHFMLQFPMIIRRSTLSNLRAHVERLHGKAFLDAFRELHSKSAYSQFNIIFTYAWYNERSQYAWHFSDMPGTVGPIQALPYQSPSLRQMIHYPKIDPAEAAAKTRAACLVYFGDPSTHEMESHRDALFTWQGVNIGVNLWTEPNMADTREAVFRTYLKSVVGAPDADKLAHCRKFADQLSIPNLTN